MPVVPDVKPGSFPLHFAYFGGSTAKEILSTRQGRVLGSKLAFGKLVALVRIWLGPALTAAVPKFVVGGPCASPHPHWNAWRWLSAQNAHTPGARHALPPGLWLYTGWSVGTEGAVAHLQPEQ